MLFMCRLGIETEIRRRTSEVSTEPEVRCRTSDVGKAEDLTRGQTSDVSSRRRLKTEELFTAKVQRTQRRSIIFLLLGSQQ
jgi:hypothetical protein